MAVYKLGAVEARFAELIWENEPLPSNRLAKLAEQELGWKKSTTYTILKRLCERGLFQNEGGQVSSLVSREEFQAAQSEQFVEEAFGGSLPAFVAAFGSRRRLTDSELDELERLVESMRG
ncbi:MAG TPA: BlaI/MecI/CopY family transcriptional regulator [Candidatus Scatomorpha intestinigallinarum]|jgi:BlaI family penicillinase repressor|uniref:BlaI/MecI/CopY family transcriptional regulator n=1 Tax=Candidatus Scatomorpha intestinigallinarum TaxID=2840923 RepID=A0A9D1DLE8_9FIRM|nr:BlaI/MecI/CopY family transcriptional regulator [Candidatus Scatomorpha intestinigallinarum]